MCFEAGDELTAKRDSVLNGRGDGEDGVGIC